MYANTINEFRSQANDGTLWLNWAGYNGGTSYYRDLRVGDGKHGTVLSVDGSRSMVGINTTTPDAPLDIEGSEPKLRITSTRTGTSWDIEARNPTAILSFKENGTDRMTLKTGGNVGIGNNSPSYKLDVNGTTAVRGELYCANRMGIGTFAPKLKLELVGDHDLMKLQSSSSSAYYQGLVFYNNKNERHAGIRAHTPYPQGSITGDLEIWTETPGADIVLGPAGGVGIGTDSPADKLDVNGNTVVRGTFFMGTPGDYRIQALVDDNESYHDPMFVLRSIINNKTTVIVPAERGFMVSDNMNNNANLQTSYNQYGDLFVRGAVVALGGFSGSDARMKTEQKPLEYSIPDIMDLQPKQYFQAGLNKDMTTGLISFDKDDGKNSIGFIAQEVHGVIPEAVHVPEDESKEIWSMDYDKIVTVLVKAMQEQQREIESLKQRIEVLEGSQ